MITKHNKRQSSRNSSSGADGEVHVEVVFNAIDLVSNPCFAELFPLPFQIRHHIGKACIFNNNEGDNLKVELKLSGRVMVGVGRDLLCQ